MQKVKYFMTSPVLAGQGAAKDVGAEAVKLGMRKAMIVIDKGVAKAGIAELIAGYLKGAGIETVIFDEVQPDPLDTTCVAGAEFAVANEVDGIIGLGGGSVMDASKAMNILTHNPLPLSQYYESWDYNKAFPLILIPTTAGTGAENTLYGVISCTETGRKRVVCEVGSLTILDPELAYGLPADITAYTGIDAFSHIVEGMTCNVLNPLTDALGIDAIKRIYKWLPIAVKEPDNLEARENMAIASNFAGTANTNTCSHLGHAMAQCIGARFHVTHGIACAWSVPEVMAYAAKGRMDQLQKIADALGFTFDENDTVEEKGQKIADFIRSFYNSLGDVKIKKISDYGITREDFQSIVDDVRKDNCYAFLPMELTRDEVYEFLGRVYDTNS